MWAGHVQLTFTFSRFCRHKADFSALKQNPEAIKLKREEWVLNHDAEAHAYAVYAATVAQLKAA